MGERVSRLLASLPRDASGLRKARQQAASAGAATPAMGLFRKAGIMTVSSSRKREVVPQSRNRSTQGEPEG